VKSDITFCGGIVKFQCEGFPQSELAQIQSAVRGALVDSRSKMAGPFALRKRDLRGGTAGGRLVCLRNEVADAGRSADPSSPCARCAGEAAAAAPGAWKLPREQADAEAGERISSGSRLDAETGRADVSFALSGAVNAGDLFTVILNEGSAVAGTFANTTQVSGSVYQFTSGNDSFEINYAFNGPATASQLTPATFLAESGGTNVAVLVLAVPEPNSWSMLLGSLAFSLGLQRFRRRRKVTR